MRYLLLIALAFLLIIAAPPLAASQAVTPLRATITPRPIVPTALPGTPAPAYPAPSDPYPAPEAPVRHRRQPTAVPGGIQRDTPCTSVACRSNRSRID